MKKAKPERVLTSLIVAAKENQPREGSDKGRIRLIVDELRNGGEIRVPLIVARDESGALMLYDGWHRYAAALEASAAWVPVEIVSDAAEARRRAAEANQHGTAWSRHDAMRHAAQRIRAGDFYNYGDTSRAVPLSVIAQEYAAFGVKRNTLTRYLDREALACSKLSAFLDTCRACNDKCNRPEEPPMDPAELTERARRRRREAAEKHMRRIAELMRGAPEHEQAETLKALAGYLKNPFLAEDF